MNHEIFPADPDDPPVPATFEELDAIPEELRHLYVQLLDHEVQRAYTDHGAQRDKEQAATAAKEALKENIRRQRDAVEEVRREREEAEISGRLTADAELFRDGRLKPRITEAHDFEVPVRTPVVDELFFRNSLTWVAGTSGTFKSFVTADLAFRYGSEDMDYHGRQMTHGRALLVIAEGAEGYAHRKAAWEKEHEREVKNVSIYPAPLQLGDTLKEMPALISYLKEEEEAGRPYGLVLFDTQAMCTVGVDENTSEMNLVINVLHRIREVSGACVMVVHHFGKQKSAGMRGSSMIYAAADTVCVLKRKEDALDVTLSTAQTDEGKQKDAIAEKDFLTLEMASHQVGRNYFDKPVYSLVPRAADTAGYDITDQTDTDIPEELPWITEQQMTYLKLASFYEGRPATPSDMAELYTREHGQIKNARQNVRNRMIELAKLKPPLVAPAGPRGGWTITPAGVGVIARQIAVGDNWVERAARRRRPDTPLGDAQTMIEQQVSQQVSGASAKPAQET